MIFSIRTTPLFICSICLWLIGCTTPFDPTPTPVPVFDYPLKGVSLSPRTAQPDDLTDFFARAQESGEVVMWAGDWAELADLEGGSPAVTAELGTTFGYLPLIEAQFFSQASGQLLRPLDEETQQFYIDSAADFAATYQPAYLGLGIEVNLLYEQAPQDFELFVSLFDRVATAVKRESPRTKLFTVFQLEHMKGLQGGLFGGVNDPEQAQWALLERFPRADLIAFTSYPSLIYQAPADIPADYYSEIHTHTGKPIALTEVAWPSAIVPTGWESSEAEQAEFVRTLFELTEATEFELIIWSFLYDPNINLPFNSMGLRRPDGTAKPAWEAWLRGKWPNS